LANAPHPHTTRILDIIIWIWIHLLKFDISNQIQDPEEDKRNKPDRPLPAGRITAQNATDVRWLLVPVCLMFSAMYGRQTLAFSACFEALSIWYNEFGGHKAGISKNVLTAIGYTCLEAGATIVAGPWVVPLTESFAVDRDPYLDNQGPACASIVSVRAQSL